MLIFDSSFSKINATPCETNLNNLISKNNREQHRHFNPKYKNLNLRQEVFGKIIKKFCSDNNLSNKTKYLAMTITDNITSKYLLDKESFKHVALIALLLSAKVIESQRNLFYLNSLKCFKYLPNKKYIEQQILGELNYDLNILTPYDFILEFSSTSKMYSGLWKISREEFNQNLFLITDLMISNYQTNKYTSLVVALCILMVTRKISGCKKLLPSFFERMSGYCEESLNSCYRAMDLFVTKFFRKNFSFKAKSKFRI
jgi:hypothetical protein